jgi:hypothetical protein
MSSSDDALTANFLIAQLIAKKKKAYAEAEEIILPALKIAAGCLLLFKDAVEKNNENFFYHQKQLLEESRICLVILSLR